VVAIWTYSAALLVTMVVLFFSVLPLVRVGEVSPAAIFVATNLLIAGVGGFFIKRYWGIIVFALGKAYICTWDIGSLLVKSLVALALLAIMIGIALAHRQHFRVF
jgi:hypothetical protein